jgi:hypothetical protein
LAVGDLTIDAQGNVFAWDRQFQPRAPPQDVVAVIAHQAMLQRVFWLASAAG